MPLQFLKSGRYFWLILAIIFSLAGWLWLKNYDPGPEKGVLEEGYALISSDKESCFMCHTSKSGFSTYHDPELIGCVACHLGDPEATEKEASHKDMVLVPGNLNDAEKTCGTCHSQELIKIQHSLMTTNSGLVAVDKFIFGETDSPNHRFDIRNLGASPVDDHLRDLCANCHLGAVKHDFGPITEISRGGGCNACHLNYSESALRELGVYKASGKKTLPMVHPSTDINVNDTHCFGCHSRSSRISTNYMGWHETLLSKEEVNGKEAYKVFEDERVYEYKGEDVHHTKGMLCIDCHSSHEVMGDGNSYLHEEDAVKLSCADCHYKGEPNTVNYDELDAESLLVFMHRNYKHQDKKILSVKGDGHPLVNTYVDEKNKVYLLGKKDGKKHLIKKQSELCSRDEAHQSLSCSSCHAQWAPRCIGCHNTYDDQKEGYDLLNKKYKTGTWVEHVFEFGAGLPAMGVRENEEGKSIVPAIPGMVLTIDHGSHPDSKDKENSFNRLYTANAPHTTSTQVRDCASCHRNPAAIGYGKGTLTYLLNETSGKWIFEPEFEMNAIDGLPEDAWIPYLKDPKAKILSTRSDVRPLNIEEQQLVLLVGSCLECHQDDSMIMKESLKTGINPLLLKVSDECLLPEFDIYEKR
jgi:hypothetical protein